MAGTTLMNYPAVENMAQVFATTGDVLDAIAKALEVAIAAAHAAAFFSLGGSEMLAQYLEGIKPKVEQLSKDSKEVSKDLKNAVKFFRDGDATAQNRFC
jgi:uncharacterized protein YukE